MAQNLKQQGIKDLNNDLLMQGLRDALEDKPTQLTHQQAGEIMNGFMQQQMATRNAESTKASAENKKLAVNFWLPTKPNPAS